ncbi:amidohydrolase family protein [Streptosporangium amethystogenes]|uniref:amidohydrolase family protein n=1 Tax=Streptosporangium amethystogenes TaxID=2002 RepID=UPI0037B24500
MTVIDDNTTGSDAPPKKRIELLPDPEPREVAYTLISVDDHLVEPRDMFEGRLPMKYQAEAPRIIRMLNGTEPWYYDGNFIPQSGSNAVVGQANRNEVMDPVGFEDMRKGTYDIHERVKDMDINGVWASVAFPSIISGFCGRIFSATKDQGLGYAVMRAWNDWFFEEWHSAYPERIVPMGITWLSDPEVGAEEIRRNAARGFTAVTFPEGPHKLGYPTLHSGFWDPILRACEETDTVLALHVGSSGIDIYDTEAPHGLSTTLFPVSSLQAAANWVWSGVCVRFPKLKILMAEGGIGWVPMLMDRLDYVLDHAGGPSFGSDTWQHDIKPSELMRRNFNYAILDDPSTLAVRDRIGVDNIMVEVDYPHADSQWPDSQEHFKKLLGHLPAEEIRKITHLNAARLFRHPLPSTTLP